MSELQIYQANIERNMLEPAQADLVLTMMQQQYGAEFNHKHEKNTKAQLRATASRILAGLSEANIVLGLQRMRHEQRCPSLSAFRELCEYWKGPNEAWADAITYTKNKKHPITELTKQALDRVKDMLIDTDDNRDAVRMQQSAGFAFREIYEGLVEQSKLANDIERPYVPQKAEASGHIGIELQIIPEKSVYEKLTDEQRAIVDMQKQLVAKGMDHRTALNQARKEIGNQKLNKLDNPELQAKVKKQPKQKFDTPFQKLVAKGVNVKDAFKQCKLEGANK